MKGPNILGYVVAARSQEYCRALSGPQTTGDRGDLRLLRLSAREAGSVRKASARAGSHRASAAAENLAHQTTLMRLPGNFVASLADTSLILSASKPCSVASTVSPSGGS